MRPGETQALIDYLTNVVREQLRSEPDALKRYEHEFAEAVEDLELGVIIDDDTMFILSIRPRIARRLLEERSKTDDVEMAAGI